MPLSEDESDEEEERLARLKARREVIVLMDPADAAAMLRSMSWEDAGQLLVLMGEERSAPAMEALTAKERSDMATVVPAAILEALGLAKEQAKDEDEEEHEEEVRDDEAEKEEEKEKEGEGEGACMPVDSLAAPPADQHVSGVARASAPRDHASAQTTALQNGPALCAAASPMAAAGAELQAPAGQLAAAEQPTAAAADASAEPAAGLVAHADPIEPAATAKPTEADAEGDPPTAVAATEKPGAADAEAAPEPSAAQAPVADPAEPTAHVATAVADAEANAPAASATSEEQPALEEQPTLEAAGIANLQSECAATQGSKSSAATATAASQPRLRGPSAAGDGADVSEAVLFSAAAMAQTPGSAGVEPVALSAKPGVCEEDEGDGIHAAWVIGNQRMTQRPGIVPVRTLGHSSWVGQEPPRSYDQPRYQDLDDGPDDEAFLSGGSRPGGGLAFRLKSSVPSKVSEMGGMAFDAAGTAAGLARHGLAAAASTGERAMGAAGSAAGVARQSLAQAAPTKVTELSQKAREAASSAADRARQSGVAQATGQRAGEATAAAKLIATEAKEKAKEKFAGAADAAKSGLAHASQSFARFTRKS